MEIFIMRTFNKKGDKLSVSFIFLEFIQEFFGTFHEERNFLDVFN